MLLRKENGQQGTAPRPYSGPGREGKMQQSAVPRREGCSREVQAAGTQISFSSEGKNVFLRRHLGKYVQEIWILEQGRRNIFSSRKGMVGTRDILFQSLF